MKQTMRFVALFLCASLLSAALLTPMAEAEEAREVRSGDYSYTLNRDSTATITQYSGDAEEVIVPGMLDGHPVTAVGDEAFMDLGILRSIVLPEGLLSIGDWAFSGCYSLVSVTLPQGLKSIGKLAFSLCESLDSLSLPDSLEAISFNPFVQAPVHLSLSSGHARFTFIDGVLFDKAEKTLISYPYYSTAEEYMVPPDVRAIGNEAFAACGSMSAVTLPQGLVSIGNGAFTQCDGLESVILPSGLESIGESAFSYCESLVSVTFPEGLLSIGDHAFDYCGSLLSAVLPVGLLEIGGWAFGNCGSLLSVTLPASVTRIGEYAFESCPQLVLRITQGSHAQLWARENGVPARFAYKGSADKDAPFIPDGTLVPLDIKLPKGKKYPVYTGPGEEYVRSGKGKATVSTNGWVQVFGLEGDWLLIQYGINEGQMRFGYISAKGLKLENGVVDLASQWEDVTLTLKEPAILSDDPLASMTDIASLPAGMQVRRLGWMGPWTYVEVRDGERLLRGFVLADFLAGTSTRNVRQAFDQRAVS